MTVSVRLRFAYTVAANILRALLSFTTGMLLARWLGPVSYGRMAFLLGTFVALRQMLDMGSATAFFTLMSQRLRSRRFVNAFCAWLAFQFLIPLVIIGLLFPARWIELIWNGSDRVLVLLALAAAFMQNSAWPSLMQAGESQRRTIAVQGIALGVVALHLIAVTLLWLLGYLGLYAVFAAIAVEYAVAVVAVRRSLTVAEEPSGEQPESVFGEYWRFCLPLIPYAWVGFAYEFADRWLLQRYGGSVQQAYYAVSAQFAAIALIATTSILNIFWKEVAEAQHRGDHARLRILYRKISRGLFFVGAAIAGYLCYWGKELLGVVLGPAYAGGALTLAIMFLFPVHQSLGQISGTFLYATQRVGLQVGVGIAFMCVSILVSYLVLAPPAGPVPGLGLASTGLAFKMVGMQLVQVNLTTYLIARNCGWRFDWAYQPLGLAGCLAAGWLAHALATEVVAGWGVIGAMALGGAVYAITLAIFVCAVPSLTGLSRAELRRDARLFIRKTLVGTSSR